MQTLKKRSDFLRVSAVDRKCGTPHFLMLHAKQPEGLKSEREARFGFTVTRKLGNAVVRNRIRRRLREAVRETADQAEPGVDYVLIARKSALLCPFDALIRELRVSLERARASRTPPGKPAAKG